MTKLELLQQEFPKLSWYSEASNSFKGIGKLLTVELYKSQDLEEVGQEAWWIDIYFTSENLSETYAVDLLFESQVWNSLESTITGTKQFISDVYQSITDLI